MKKQEKKVVSLHGKNKQLKEHSRKRLWRSLFYAFLGGLVLVSVYFVSPLSRLGVIYFEGLQTFSRSELISLMEIQDDELFIGLNPRKMQQLLESHPLVESASITLLPPNRLRVQVVENQVVLCAVVDEEMYHVLVDGTMLHESIAMRPNCDSIILQGLTEIVPNENVPEFLHLTTEDVIALFALRFQEVDQDVIDIVQLIEHTPKYGDYHRFSLYMRDGNVVIVNSHTMAEKLNLYHVMLANIESGVNGTFHLDVGNTFIPYGHE